MSDRSTAASPLGRPVGASGEQTRARIIAAAMRCVAEVGYSKATIREIAKAAEMTSGSLYHYFPNKSALLAATAQDIDEIAAARLRAAAGLPGDVVDRFEAVLDEMHRLLREYPHLAAFDRAMGAEAAAHPRRGGVRGPGLKALRDIIDAILDEARTRRALPPATDPGAAGHAIYALARGLMERAAQLTPDAYSVTLDSAKELIRGTLFAPRASRRESRAQRRSKPGP
ncbi:TetR/AcrR family transcriptional regulator [Mycobacterium interjectum]|uniref:TetR/AcrR family transcriptional regulator n=1 Tax=Mycobacterium interjectum TaxID=33895 RepID=UPI000837362B|nr:TetR/AcrR family transcriptional regulator [Mycobacterium interjectum]